MLFPPAPLPNSPEALLRTGEALWVVSRSGRGPTSPPMFSDHQQVRAVSITELDRSVSAVLVEAQEQLAAGETTELARWRPKVSRFG